MSVRERINKIIFHPATTIVLFCLMIGCLVYTVKDINLIERTVSQAGYDHRISFFFWVLTLDLIFLINVKKLNRTSGINSRLVEIVCWVSFGVFLLTGIHNWHGAEYQTLGLFLHTIPAIIFVALELFAFAYIGIKHVKTSRSKATKIWLISVAVFIPLCLVGMIMLPSAIFEILPFMFFFVWAMVFIYLQIPRETKNNDKEGDKKD